MFNRALAHILGVSAIACLPSSPLGHPDGSTATLPDGNTTLPDGSVCEFDCDDPCAVAAANRSSVGCVYYAVDTNPLHSSSLALGDYAVAVSNVDPTAAANVTIE